MYKACTSVLQQKLTLDGNSWSTNFHHSRKIVNNLRWRHSSTGKSCLLFISRKMHTQCGTAGRIEIVGPGSIPFNSFSCAACYTGSSGNSQPR